MPRQIQSQVIQQPQQQEQGNPFLQMVGTFLPMAFGLPPMPALGELVAGKMPSAGGMLGTIGGFGGLPGIGGGFLGMPPGINPHASGHMQGPLTPGPWAQGLGYGGGMLQNSILSGGGGNDKWGS